jgi:acetyl-CoA C-acetyltransferase
MKGIFDNKVVIVGGGCCKFGENWLKSSHDMIIDASLEALRDAGIENKDIQAVWVGNQNEKGVGPTVADALKFHNLPISHCENWCSSGLDAFRNACFAVASGIYDRVLVIGYEKLKETGIQGIPPHTIVEGGHPVLFKDSTTPPFFALLATKYFERWGINKVPLAKVAVKNHHNGSLTPKAHLQNEITLEQALNAPMIAWPLGIFDCCGLTDGAAAVVLTKRELAKSFREDFIIVRGIGLSVSPLPPQYRPHFQYIGFTETEVAAKQAYEQAAIRDPRKDIDCAEVHDCFTITEIVDYEDLHFCERGHGWQLIEDGITTLEGDLPVNMDGGLKCFGHPVGASGVRMIYEIYKQLQAKCGNRQVRNANVGLAQTVGGYPTVGAVVVLSNP